MVRNRYKDIFACLVVITCLVVRAVHLEPVTNLGTEKCLIAIDRFCSRRGNPDFIYSDKGTNFQGAANIHLGIARPVSTRSTECKFIPTGTPYQGGVWERLIGMSKRILYSIVGSKRLNDECFHIVLLGGGYSQQSSPYASLIRLQRFGNPHT